ncbi:hypothetical protein BH10PSE7_BH10PSE7_40840 [soil metagenome]
MHRKLYMEALIGLVGVLIGIGGTLGTSYLLAVRQEASEVRSWRRDRALEMYSEFLKAVEAVTFEANAAFFASDCGTDEHAKQHGVVLEKIAGLDRTARRVFLIAPDEVNALLMTLALYTSKEIGGDLSACPKVDESQQKAANVKLAELLITFTNAARSDLGVHPELRTIQEWKSLTTK